MTVKHVTGGTEPQDSFRNVGFIQVFIVVGVKQREVFLSWYLQAEDIVYRNLIEN